MKKGSKRYFLIAAFFLLECLLATISFESASAKFHPSAPAGTGRLLCHKALLSKCSDTSEQTVVTATASRELDPSVASKFKIVTCSSTTCASKRKSLHMDEFSTFSAFWTRIQDECPAVRLKEGPCLGSCRSAPCVAIEHDDFVGTVSLEGMTESEFSERVFHKVITEEDADRVWEAVENAIHIIAEVELVSDDDQNDIACEEGMV